MNLLSRAARYIAGADVNPATRRDTNSVEVLVDRMRTATLPEDRRVCVEHLIELLRHDEVLASSSRAAGASGSRARGALLQREVGARATRILLAILEQDRSEVELVRRALELLVLLVTPLEVVRESDWLAEAGAEEPRLSSHQRDGDDAVAAGAERRATWAGGLELDEAAALAREVAAENTHRIMGWQPSEHPSRPASADPEQVGLVLDLFRETDFYIRYNSIDLFTTLLSNAPTEMQASVLQSPMGVTVLVDTLKDPREVIRNAGLLLLTNLAGGNSEIQKILAFEGVFERLFDMIDASRYETVEVSSPPSLTRGEIRRLRVDDAEPADIWGESPTDERESDEEAEASSDLLARAHADVHSRAASSGEWAETAATLLNPSAEVVVHDCLHLVNILLEGNASNVRFFRETGCIPRLNAVLDVKGMATDVSLPSGANLRTALRTVELLTAAAGEPESSTLSRQMCLHHGVSKAVMRLVAARLPDTSARRQALQSLAALATAHEATQQVIRAAVLPCAQHARVCRGDDTGGATNSTRPIRLLRHVLEAMIDESESLAVRAAAYVLLRHLLVASESGIECFLRLLTGDGAAARRQRRPSDSNGPDVQADADQDEESLRAVAHELLCAVVGWPDATDPPAVFYAASLLAQLLLKYPSREPPTVRERLLSRLQCGPTVVRVAERRDALPAGESFLMRCVRSLSRADRERGPALVRIALLMLLSAWIHDCPAALEQFLGSALHVPLVVELIKSEGSRADGALAEQVRGLAALLLAICMEEAEACATTSATPVSSAAVTSGTLVEIVKNRIGVMHFASCLEDLRASDLFVTALANVQVAPARIEERKAAGRTGLGHDVLYDVDFTAVMATVYARTQHRLVELFSAASPRRMADRPEDRDAATSHGRRSYAPRRSAAVPVGGAAIAQNHSTTLAADDDLLGGTSALQSRIQELEAELSLLTNYKQIIREQDLKISASQEEVAQLKSALAEAERRADTIVHGAESRYQAELRQLTERVTAAEARMQDAAQHNAALETELCSRERDMNALSSAVAALEAENEELRGAAASARSTEHERALPADTTRDSPISRVAALEAENARLRQEAAATAAQALEGPARSPVASPTTEEVDQLHRELAAERNRVARLSMMLGELEHAESEEEDELRSVRRERDMLLSRIRDLEEELEQLRNRNDRDDGAVLLDNSSPPQIRDAERPELDVTILETGAPLFKSGPRGADDLWATVAAADTDAPTALQEALERTRAELAEARAAQGRLEEDAYETQAALESRLFAAEEELQRLRATTTTTTASPKTEDLDGLRGQLQSAVEEAAMWRDRVSPLQAQVDAQRAELDAVHAVATASHGASAATVAPDANASVEERVRQLVSERLLLLSALRACASVAQRLSAGMRQSAAAADTAGARAASRLDALKERCEYLQEVVWQREQEAGGHIRDLTEQCQLLQARAKERQAALEQAQQQLDELTQQLMRKEEEIEGLQETVLSLEESVAGAEALQMAGDTERQRERERVCREAQAAQAEVERLREQLSRAEQEGDALRVRLSSMEADAEKWERVQERLRATEQERDALRVELEDAAGSGVELEQLRERLTAVQSERDGLQQRLAESVDEHTERQQRLQAQLSAVERERQEWQSRCSEMEREQQRLQETLQRMGDEQETAQRRSGADVAQLRAQVEMQAAELDTCRSHIEQLESQWQTDGEALTAAQARTEELEAQWHRRMADQEVATRDAVEREWEAKWRQVIDEHRRQREAYDARIALLESCAQDREETIQRMSEEHERLLSELEQEVHALQQTQQPSGWSPQDPERIAELEAQLTTERMASGDLRQQVIDARAQLQELQQMLDWCRDEVVGERDAETSAQVEALDTSHPARRILSLRQALSEAETERQAVLGQLADCRERLAAMESRAAEREQTLPSLQRQRDALLQREASGASAVEMLTDENARLSQEVSALREQLQRMQRERGSPPPGRTSAGATEQALAEELSRLQEEHNEQLICLAEMENECSEYKQRLVEVLHAEGQAAATSATAAGNARPVA